MRSTRPRWRSARAPPGDRRPVRAVGEVPQPRRAARHRRGAAAGRRRRDRRRRPVAELAARARTGALPGGEARKASTASRSRVKHELSDAPAARRPEAAAARARPRRHLHRAARRALQPRRLPRAGRGPGRPARRSGIRATSPLSARPGSSTRSPATSCVGSSRPARPPRAARGRARRRTGSPRRRSGRCRAPRRARA